MDFELSDDQVALQDGVRTFLQGRFPIDVVRGLEDHGGIDRARWQELADMGIFALRLDEADGGVGLGWADAVLVFEELGRALVPGPTVWTHLLAGRVPGASTGEAVVGGVERDDFSGIIEFPDGIDTLVVLDAEGIWAVHPDDLELAPIATPLDTLTPVARLVGALPQGERIGSADDAAALRLQGATLVAGYLLGIAEATTDLSVAYAKEREQFDRPIGMFQALKHHMADMFARAEVARGGVYAAGVTLDDPLVGSVERAVASAKFTAGEAAIENTKSAVQVHGGMGYTWEIDAHLQLKRAYALDPLFGGRDEQADTLADLLDTLV